MIINHAIMKKSLLLLLASFCVLPLAGAASFDCAKAKSKQEKIICADPELSALDDSLAAAYKKARVQTPQALQKTLSQWQKQWLEGTQECADSRCLKVNYQSQIDNLSHISPAAPSGKYVRYWKGKPDANSAGIDVIALTNNKAYVDGNAIWLTGGGSANVGDINGVLPYNQQRIRYVYTEDGQKTRCEVTLTPKANGLTVSGSSMACGWGMNVSFDGDYRKVK